MPRPATARILSGGFGHPFSESTPLLASALEEVDVTCQVITDVESGARSLASDPVDLLVVNALRWRMLADRFDDHRDEWAYVPSEPARQAIADHVARGAGVLGVHTASICFDDWAGWREILGGAWNWDHSHHPPLDTVTVQVVSSHPLVDGLTDFAITDEVYGFLDVDAGIRPLLTSSHGGEAHPMLWARHVGDARVVYDALGHDQRSMSHPVHRRILQRSARWLVGDTDEQVAGL